VDRITAAKELLEAMISALSFDDGMCSQAAMGILLLKVLENQEILAREVARLGLQEKEVA
jgi:hypothetical protein